MCRILFVSLVCLGACGCELKSTSPPPPAPIVSGTPVQPDQVVEPNVRTPAPQVKIESFESKRTFSGLSVLLIPVPLAEGQERCSSDNVSGKLFPGLATDEESRSLLQRLYDGQKVELHPHTDREQKPEATEPPAEGFTVSIRGNLFLGRPDATLEDGRRAGYFAAAIFVRVPAESVPPGAIAGRFDSLPDDFQALILASNDYFLRKLPGWTLVDGRGANDIYSYEAPKSTPEEQRAELDAKTAEYLKRFNPPAK